MEGPLPAAGLMCELILERLWGALQVIAESWGYLSGLLGVPWGILAGCVQMLCGVPWGNLAGFVKMLFMSPERARSLRERKQVNEKLRKQTASLQAEESSLRCEILQLVSQLLQLKLQSPLELHQERARQLESQITKEEKRCAEIEKKLINWCRNRYSKFQILQLRKKIVEDMGKELERTRSFYQRELLLHEKRAQKSWEAAVQTERDLLKLREGDRIRQMLPNTQAHLQPFPSGPSPVAPPAAHGGHKLS
ncbi:Ctage Family Member 2 [Manis pentadactyla]|nr:Ctage Family Member 2 [Manis pentadactyla]